MQIKQLHSILNETLIGLPFFEGNINNITIWTNAEKQGWIKIIKEQENDVFTYSKIVLRIEKIHFGKTACYDSFITITTPANQENLFKTIINSILAYLKKRDVSNLKEKKETRLREDFFDAFKIKNSNYFNHNLVYATTYGLGYYCLLLNEVKFNEINKKISQFLDKRKIDFKNEFSDACWVYRFKFRGLKEDNKKLLYNLILEL